MIIRFIDIILEVLFVVLALNRNVSKYANFLGIILYGLINYIDGISHGKKKR